MLIEFMFVFLIRSIDVAVRKDYARRSHEASREWRDRMEKAENSLGETEETHRAVGAGMFSKILWNVV